MSDEFHGFGLSYEEVCERFSFWARGANCSLHNRLEAVSRLVRWFDWPGRTKKHGSSELWR